jgi:hypothetical protein
LFSAAGIIAGLRELRAAGVIENVSFGMNANADHMIITPEAGGAVRNSERNGFCPLVLNLKLIDLPRQALDKQRGGEKDSEKEHCRFEGPGDNAVVTGDDH